VWSPFPGQTDAGRVTFHGGHFAFVVGNNAYPEVPGPLTKCENDAGDMATLLSGVGYHVTHLLNAKKRQCVGSVLSFVAPSIFGIGHSLSPPRTVKHLCGPRWRDAFTRFSDELPDGSCIVVHYSGHGCEREGQNYLVPVDGVINTAAGAYNEGLACESVRGGNPGNLHWRILH
jgi:hypothetical protein